MRVPSTTFAMMLALGMAVATASAAGAQTDQPSARKKRPAPTTGLQIACTRVGCNPIPRGCRIEKEYGWDGLPTGYDAVVCPFR